ncbi:MULTISPECIES: hypothetical protein [Janibacter]|uniref:hypothetical protein n=1 Tax=Janibacter TaxID=53457 RepID=UPI00082D72BD|nr:hypothetical protein [Janibacter terrae]MBA4086083.1 hypothetical protein [Kytococcus sp.]HBO54299.1 hypothetical protein [Janibacter terrae]
MTTRETPLERHRRVLAVAADTDHVMNHAALRAIDVTRQQAARQVAAGRWARHGSQTFAMHTGELSFEALCRRAVWEVGERVTLVDGVTSLRLAGLKGWQDDDVHVSLLHTHDPSPRGGIRIHKVIRRTEGEALTLGIPRTRPAVAAIRAAHWAATDRAAATILAMTAQQRLATGWQLVDAQHEVRGRTRRAFIKQVVRDVADGAQSLGELDFTAACRSRGLPEPTRQAVRRGRDGRVYLDAYFEEYGVVVEIDGAGHLWGLTGVADALRANQVVIDGDRVLRINLIGWRLDEDAFMDQLTFALGSNWARDNLARYLRDHPDVTPPPPIPAPSPRPRRPRGQAPRTRSR